VSQGGLTVTSRATHVKAETRYRLLPRTESVTRLRALRMITQLKLSGKPGQAPPEQPAAQQFTTKDQLTPTRYCRGAVK